MKVKVCGMRAAANIKALGALEIDLMGFVFYPKSSRYVSALPLIEIPNTTKRVGVFVNANVVKIEEAIRDFQLDYLQLHGDEQPEDCQVLKKKGYAIIKAFAVDEDFDFDQLKAYETSCDFFLLDAKGKSYGGNGIQFDWTVLQKYVSKIPFFLSGGIDLESIKTVQSLEHPALYGIDVNSKFEIEPALKDIDKVQELLQSLKSNIK